MRHVVVLSVLLVNGCAAAAHNWAPVARPSAAACTAPDAPSTASWQLVKSPVFTFCVPGTWQSVDGRTWRSGGSVIGWCTAATPSQCPNVSMQVSGEVTLVTPGQLPGAPRPASFGTGCSSSRSAEDVGGASADLTESHCGGHHVTEAYWPSLALRFLGETDDAATAQLELQIYRTVRITISLGH